MNGGVFEQKPIRTLLLFVLVLVALFGFLASIYNTSTKYRKLPPRQATIHDRALRGKIISEDGYTLSKSSKTYQATVFTQSINPNRIEVLVKLFSIYSNISEDKIRKNIKKSKGYCVIARDIDANTAIRLKSLDRKLRKLNVFNFITNKRGVRILYSLNVIENGETRSFPLRDTMSPILGYTHRKNEGRYKKIVGIKGLEKRYEQYLKDGINGFIKGTRDVSSTIIRNIKTKRVKRIDGMDIHLNIPLALQRRVELTLDEMQNFTRADEIIAGVMESSTGKVIALASSQRFNPERIKDSETSRLNPKFGEFQYEPGSVMKPITLSLAFEHNIVTPDTWIETENGKFRISKQYVISDDEPFKTMTVTDIIVHSSNIGATKIGWQLSGKDFYNGLRSFGFGVKSGIDLSKEQKGRTYSAKQLTNKVNKASQSYGYGMYATFLQLWKAYNIFNNNGTIITPTIIDYIQKPNGKLLSKQQKKQPISKKSANMMKRILKKVVSVGTGKAAIYPGLEIGGKTGTAHIVKHGKYIDKYNSSFYGFANDKSGNKYTIGVLAINLDKKHMHFASQSAVPTFKKIVENLVELDYLEPDFSTIEREEAQKKAQKRQELAKKKQRQRIKEIKAKLKRERDQIKRKKHTKKKRRIKHNKKLFNSLKKPTKRYKPKRNNNIPDMF